jgi:hypothetical protein
MENWDLRREQVRSIVGTKNTAALHRALDAARTYMAAQVRAPGPDRGPRWEFVGPSNVSGRVTALAIDPRGTGTLYAGTAAGGVFRSADAGDSWQALWTRGPGSLAIGGLGLCATRPEVVYAATGEWEGRVSSTTYHHFAGAGAYVSDDGGTTWRWCGPLSTSDRRASRWTSAVAVDPSDPAHVFVAGDRALHRSTDFGATWHEVLVPNPEESDGLAPADMVVNGAVTDVVVDPDSPGVVYAAAHRIGVLRSDEGGQAGTFRPLTLPGVAPADCLAPKIALGPRGETGARAVVVLTATRVFTSRDGGATFRPVAEPLKSGVKFFAWCTAAAVHPTRPRVMLAGHEWLWRSLDGGDTAWERHGTQPVLAGSTHADVQAIVFDPAQPDHVYVATDGGVYRTRNVRAAVPIEGGLWEHCSRGLNVTQCYTVAVARNGPVRIGVTTQDLGAYVYLGGDGPHVDPARDWRTVHHWEGGWIEFDPAAPRTFYLDTRAGKDGVAPDHLRRTPDDGNSWDTPAFPDATGTRFQSDCTIREALAIAAQQPACRLLIARLASEPRRGPFHLYRSITAGVSWQRVAEVDDVAAVEISADARRAYAGGRGGQLWWSGPGGAWRPVTVDAALPVLPVNDLEISPVDHRVVYMAFGGADVEQGVSEGVIFPVDAVAVWRLIVADDGRASAEPASGAGAAALPPRLPITGLEIDPRHPDHLYASHLAGVHRSTDAGQTWTPLVQGLPDTFVSDLDLDERSHMLYAATMGRGVFRLALPV